MKASTTYMIAVLLCAVLAVSAQTYAYTTYAPIGNAEIYTPTEYAVLYANTEYAATCKRSTDCDLNGSSVVWDPVTHTWSGPGSFSPSTGTSVTWTSPDTTGWAHIYLTASDSPLADDPDKDDSVLVYLVKVTDIEIHTTNSYNDNSGDGLNDCQVHFDERNGSAYPDLYIEIAMQGGTSTTAVDTFTLAVTSESDPNGINVAFTETGVNTGIYRSDNPIHLAAVSSQDNRELKVLDEEKLSMGGCDSVKVDRGEVATVTADVGSVPQYMADDGADAIDVFLDKDEANNVYSWWDGGEVREETTTADLTSFVQNVGTSATSAPADFLFLCSHGGNGNVGYITGTPAIYKPGGGTPTIGAADWDDDMEWVIFYCCMILGSDIEYHPTAYVGYWDDALKGKTGDNLPHGILSSADLMWANPTKTHMEELCDAIEDNNDTVFDAYFNAAMDVSPKQWGSSYLCHSDNLNDRLNNVTADANDSSMTSEYYCDWDPNWNVGYEANEVWGLGGDTFTCGVTSGYEVQCAIPAERPTLRKMSVAKESRNQKAVDSRGFTQVRSRNTGRLQFRKAARERGAIRLTKGQSLAKAASFIAHKGGGTPVDAELRMVRKSVMVTYDADDPIESRQSHVRKVFLEYGHSIDGIPVAGGNRGDSIFVELNGDEVVAFNRHWRDVAGATGSAQQVISAQDALGAAVEAIPKAMPGADDVGYSITAIKLFYHGLPSEARNQTLTPAWGFLVNQSLWVYVDAFTGEFLD